METVLIIVYRYSKTEKWQLKIEALFSNREVAEGYMLGLQTIHPEWDYAIVHGTFYTPEATA